MAFQRARALIEGMTKPTHMLATKSAAERNAEALQAIREADDIPERAKARLVELLKG